MRDQPEQTESVTFLNPFTCGIYKNGALRYKFDPKTGKRTDKIDNELGDQVRSFLDYTDVPGSTKVPLDKVFGQQILVPRYYDERWVSNFYDLIQNEELNAVSLGDLETKGVISVRGGHGSPSNDNRSGNIPYIKVSDIRSLRINVNPTNLVSEVVAQQFWRGTNSGLEAWDLITPNRASSNIGEFAVLIPGDEDIVVTKEVFVLRVNAEESSLWDPFYLLWTLCLKAVRQQWQRITLMQTNREDVGQRYREILLPEPRSEEWAKEVSAPFRNYFHSLAEARRRFSADLSSAEFDYIESAHSVGYSREASDQ